MKCIASVIKLVFGIKMLFASTLLQAAIYNTLDYGVPTHAVGYADLDGYVLYTKLLEELCLRKNYDPKKSQISIPIRMVFATNFEDRKSFFVESFWGISLYDSYLQKVNSYNYRWVSLDLNIVNFKKDISTGCYWASDGSVCLKEGKDGLVTIVATDTRAEGVSLVFKDGFLNKIFTREDGKLRRFQVYRTSMGLSIRDEMAAEVFTLRKIYDDKKFNDAENSANKASALTVLVKVEKLKCYFNGKLLTIELPTLVSVNGKRHVYEYSFDSEKSKLAWAKNRYIEWNTQTGKIEKDWISSYSSQSEPNGKKTVVRKFPWGEYKHVYMDKRGINRVYAGSHSVETHYIYGNPSLFSMPRKHIIYKDDKKTGVIQKIYDPEGRQVKTIIK